MTANLLDFEFHGEAMNEDNEASSSAWKVLDYEVQMFCGLKYVRCNLQGSNSLNCRLIRNALVESSLLHIRILSEIFLSLGKYPDDIKLIDLGYIKDSLPLALDEHVRALKIAYGDSRDTNSNCWIINKRLAHPTTYRSDQYNYEQVFQDMEKPLEDLINNVYSFYTRDLPYWQKNCGVGQVRL